MRQRNGFRLGSLASKVQMVFAGLFLVLLMAVGAILYLSLEGALLTRNESELTNTTEMIQRMVTLYVDKATQNYLRAIAEKNRELAAYYYGLSRKGIIGEAEAYARFEELLLDPEYGRIGTTGYIAGINSQGVTVLHPRSPGVDASKFPFIQEAIRTKNGYISYEWRNVGEETPREKSAYLSYFEPWDLILFVSSYRSEFTSLIDIDDLSKVITSINIGMKGYPFIMDLQGRLVIHPKRRGDLVLDETDAAGRRWAREMIERKNGKIRISAAKGAKQGITDRIAYFTSLPDMGWIVVSVAPLKEVYALLGTVRNILLGAILVAVVLSYFVVSGIFGRMLRPVSRIRSVAEAVSKGNFSRRIEVSSADEIGQISIQFNAMMNNFEEILKRVRTSSEVLTESVHNLSASAQEISTTSNQQAASVKEIVSTMEDSERLSHDIAGRINEVASIANGTKDTVAQGFDLIQNSLGKMDEIKEANAQRITGVKSLGDRIETIWDIVNIINAIADQTKIIAFNAELEAAAAGDAGKNFKIVASEIRRLADSTVASTGEIKAKINEIQHSSDHLIIASEEVTEKIAEGWDLSSRLRKVFEEILSSSEISANSAGHIALSINQQANAFEQILQTLKQISEGIDNFVLSTQSTTEASQRLEETAGALNGLLQRYVVQEEGRTGSHG